MAALKMCLFLGRECDLQPRGWSLASLAVSVRGLGLLFRFMLSVLGRSWGLCSRSWGLCSGKNASRTPQERPKTPFLARFWIKFGSMFDLPDLENHQVGTNVWTQCPEDTPDMSLRHVVATCRSKTSQRHVAATCRACLQGTASKHWSLVDGFRGLGGRT